MQFWRRQEQQQLLLNVVNTFFFKTAYLITFLCQPLQLPSFSFYFISMFKNRVSTFWFYKTCYCSLWLAETMKVGILANRKSTTLRFHSLQETWQTHPNRLLCPLCVYTSFCSFCVKNVHFTRKKAKTVQSLRAAFLVALLGKWFYVWNDATFLRQSSADNCNFLKILYAIFAKTFEGQ